MKYTRRNFLRGASAAATGAALGDIGGWSRRCAADELAVTPDIVKFTPEIEPVVRLIEDTPREKCFEMVIRQLQAGLPYRRFVAGLYLAGIRNVRPHPLGFKFHCVLAMHAAHQLSLDAAVNERLLPIFWMLDDFKKSQQRDVAEGDFKMPPVKGRLPSREKAWKEFHAAMDAWDEERADRAITVLARTRGALEVIEGLWRYGARDYRNIGHKPIYVAGAWRMLQTIGWRYAEPILRSVAMGMTDFGPAKRVNDYAFEDQCFLANQERVAAIDPSAGLTAGKEDPAAVRDMLDVIRSGDFDAAGKQAADRLRAGAGTRNLWDAAHLAAAELMMRQPGIYGIHTVTSVNALRYASQTSSRLETRVLMLFQAIGWMCQFRNFMSEARGGLQDVDITALEPAAVPDEAGEAIEDIFSAVGADTPKAAAKTLTFAGRYDAAALTARARQLILLKNREVHGLKYPVAIFEDHDLVSPRWRPQILATATYYLPGSGQADSTVMQQAREALRAL